MSKTFNPLDKTTYEGAHKFTDADAGAFSIHHSLGTGNTQASPGDHTHDGRNSKKLLEGQTLNLSGLTTEQALAAVINILATKFGLTVT